MRLSIAICLMLGLSCSQLSASDDASVICSRLVNDGFENVKVCCINQHKTIVQLEDNHYHSISYGLAQALRLISPDAEANDTIELVALENKVPKITVTTVHTVTGWQIDTRYGGVNCPQLDRLTANNNSSYRLDIVVYPDITFSNYRYDRLWSVATYLSPALEMSLWQGAKVTAQLKVPIWNNYADHDYGKLRPGYVSLQQQILSDQQWNVSAAAGLFSLDRYGIDVRGYYHLSTRFDVGMIAGITGSSYDNVNDDLKFGAVNSVNLLACASYFEPRYNLQIDLKGGRFVHDDYGVRLDLLRHYRDYAIGFYGCLSDYGTNLGFQFSVPMGPKKMGCRRAARVRLPRAYYFSFNENTNSNKEHTFEDITQLYQTAPDQTPSSRYWQPELIKDNILYYLESE